MKRNLVKQFVKIAIQRSPKTTITSLVELLYFSSLSKYSTLFNIQPVNCIIGVYETRSGFFFIIYFEKLLLLR